MIVLTLAGSPRLACARQTDDAQTAKIAFRARASADLSYVEMAFANDSAAACLLNLGHIAAGVPILGSLRFELRWPGRAPMRVIDLSGPALVAGQLAPYVIVMAGHSKHVIRIPANKLFITALGRPLADLQDRHWSLDVTYNGTAAVENAPGAHTMPFGQSNGLSQLRFTIGQIRATVAYKPALRK